MEREKYYLLIKVIFLCGSFIGKELLFPDHRQKKATPYDPVIVKLPAIPPGGTNNGRSSFAACFQFDTFWDYRGQPI